MAMLRVMRFLGGFLVLVCLMAPLLCRGDGAVDEGTGAPWVWLDEIPPGFIANAYGPPNRGRSYGKGKLSVAGKEFEHGLGTHAPSHLTLRLAGRAVRFEAVVGVDAEVMARYGGAEGATVPAGLPRYVYAGNGDLLDRRQGATVRFRVIADGVEVFDTGWMNERSEARRIELNVLDVRELELVVDGGVDGFYADHADWGDARLQLAAGETAKGLVVEGSPAGLIMNHAGFLPEATKRFVLRDSEEREFTVVSVLTGQGVQTGRTTLREGDWGRVYEGDFSAFMEEGDYFVHCGDRVSPAFRIGADLHTWFLDKHLNWFLWQRCGDPVHGWERGQHADDGRRSDTKAYQDVAGGWHDAADLRKWGMTITGLWALADWALALEEGSLKRRVLDEIQWGNRYFLRMQEPAGYMMSHVGGDVSKHGDNNRFTDNVVDTPDDRVIVVTPAAPDIQFVFAMAEVAVSRVFAKQDPEYSKRCREAASRAYAWQLQRLDRSDPHAVGGALAAASRLFGATLEGRHRAEAMECLKALLDLQDAREGIPSGFFVRRQTVELEGGQSGVASVPAHNLPMGNLPLWGLCTFCEVFVGAPEATRALQALYTHVEGTVLPLAERSTYGQLPYSFYATDPGGGRMLGELFYRWGYVNHEDDAWWNGVTPHLASTGAALAKAARILGRPELRAIAQRQLDFVLGANPFNASTVEGVGYNQPDFFKTTEFVPHTPRIVGAVMAGIGTSEEDQPILLPGWWQTTEYWMESVAHTMLLMNELARKP
jgi:hypothetical protein